LFLAVVFEEKIANHFRSHVTHELRGTMVKRDGDHSQPCVRPNPESYVVEPGELGQESPHHRVTCVKRVRPVLVDHHSALRSIVAIAPDMVADFENLNVMTVPAQLKSRSRPG
jgi:hypothetical protein